MNDKQQKSISTIQLGFQSFWKIERFVQLNKFTERVHFSKRWTIERYYLSEREVPPLAYWNIGWDDKLSSSGRHPWSPRSRAREHFRRPTTSDVSEQNIVRVRAWRKRAQQYHSDFWNASKWSSDRKMTASEHSLWNGRRETGVF